MTDQQWTQAREAFSQLHPMLGENAVSLLIDHVEVMLDRPLTDDEFQLLCFSYETGNWRGCDAMRGIHQLVTT